MAQKRLVAPDTPITSYPTPEVADIVITVDVDSRLPGYKVLEYGTLYPDQTRYPGAKLVAQTPLEDDRFVRRVFATDRVNQETYNYAIQYSAGEPDYPIYVRTYVEPRDTYVPLADNSPDPVIPGAFLVDEEAAPADGELNNLYLKVTRIYETLPGPWVPSSRYDDDLGLVQIRRRSVVNSGQVASLTENTRTTYEARDGSTGVYTELEESWSTELDGEGNSQFPVKDRDIYDPSRGAIQERRQLVSTTGSEAASLVNNNGVITQISYEAYNEFLSFEIVQTYSVNGPQLTGFVTTNEGQLATVTTQRKGSDSYVAPQPTATKTVEVDREDAESVVERVIDIPEVFAGEIYRKVKEDTTPTKFRAAVSESTVEQNTAGQADSNITLGPGEFVKTEQQVTKFVKRTSTTSRARPTTSTLTEQILTNQGQLGTRTLTLSSGAQVITPLSALIVDSNVEALGDGRTVKTVVTVPVVFDNKTVSSSKPDVLPERFRASVPTETTQETIEQTSVVIPSLDSNDLEKTEERVSEFTVRKSTTSRNVEEIPDLDGIDYEESFDVQIPYTERISTTKPTGSAEAVPLDDTRYLVREYDADNIESYLSDFLQTYPTTISMDLPRVLESVTIDWDEKESEGSYVNEPDTAGVFYSFSSEDKGEASTLSSATPLVGLNFKDVWSRNISATVFIFFLKNPVTESAILSKTGSSKWPTFKPKSHIITGKGVELRASVSVKSSISIQQPKPAEFSGYSDSSKQKDYARTITPVIVNIPTCLHESILIAGNKTVTATVSATASTAGVDGSFGPLNTSETATVTDTAYISGSLAATSPPDIPKSGKYLIDSNVDFFKYGFSIVRATVIDASVFA